MEVHSLVKGLWVSRHSDFYSSMDSEVECGEERVASTERKSIKQMEIKNSFSSHLDIRCTSLLTF